VEGIGGDKAARPPGTISDRHPGGERNLHGVNSEGKGIVSVMAIGCSPTRYVQVLYLVPFCHPGKERRTSKFWLLKYRQCLTGCVGALGQAMQ
jgi:hypothetical protein